MDKKICPLMIAGANANKIAECIEHKCAWWVDTYYSTENISQKGECAIRLIPVMNSDGRLVV